MKKRYSCPLFLVLVLIGFQCVPPEKEIITELNLSLEDPTLQKIIHFQDTQQTDSLYTFFRHPDPSYRYSAAMAFASIQNRETIDSLAVLLKDPVPEVRTAAAYSLGQTGDSRVVPLLTNGFQSADTTGTFNVLNGTILEAIGKSGNAKSLQLLSTISTYQPADTVLLLGQARGIYRFALRGMVNEQGTLRMVEMATDLQYPPEVRLMAAHYLARAKDINLEKMKAQLENALLGEPEEDVRMALATALGKLAAQSFQTLTNQFVKEKDYRVKVNIIRAMKEAPYDSIRSTIFAALGDLNLPVAQTAAELLVQKGIAKDATAYWREAKVAERPWQVKYALYDAANIHLPAYQADFKEAINAELRQAYINAQTPVERAKILEVLGGFGWNYRFILEQMPTITNMLERTAVTSAIQRIVNNPDFNRLFGVSRRRVSRELSDYLLGVFRSGDAGSMAIAAAALQSESVDFKSLLQDSLSVIVEAQEALPLPEATETYNEVQKAVNYLRYDGAEITPVRPDFNHPIDTEILSKVTNNAAAVIQTDKGKIRLELFPLLAPGTVVNFIQLSEDGFFKGKTFHRVVPNFVIQGGCPRGDGYGSLEYSIRSELGMAYYDDEGYVGMASAGNHTEGTQFFITHSPTPHLDGKYTIFGKVIDGMNIVHRIEAGDEIQSIAIRY